MFSLGIRAVFGALTLCATLAASIAPAAAQYWQCAPYARSISGIEIFGNANTWWDQAAGKYERGNAPAEGSVLAFKAHGKMRVGHVAMVSRLVAPREVRLTHANWSRGGRIERDVRAIDVSEAGDWNKVKVWYASMRDVGLTSYPTHGFIYPKAASEPVRYAENRLADIGALIEGLRE